MLTSFAIPFCQQSANTVTPWIAAAIARKNTEQYGTQSGVIVGSPLIEGARNGLLSRTGYAHARQWHRWDDDRGHARALPSSSWTARVQSTWARSRKTLKTDDASYFFHAAINAFPGSAMSLQRSSISRGTRTKQRLFRHPNADEHLASYAIKH